MKRLTPGLAATVLVLIACGGNGHVDGTFGSRRPEPSEPATGPVVAAIDVAGTSFELHDEGAGCLAVEIAQPGLQATIERQCFEGPRVVAATSTCGWLTTPDEARPFDCDVRLPGVLYGQVTDPNVGYVCIGTIRDSGGSSGVTGARLLEQIAPGFILAAAHPGESPRAHLFTRGGLRYGQPPLDAPSDPIYRLCEGQAPWGEPGLEYRIDLFVSYAEPLQTDDITVFFHSGLDRIGLSGGAFDDDENVRLPVRVPASSSVLGIDVETEIGPILQWDYQWPEELLTILQSTVACHGLTEIHVTVESDVLDGSDAAIELDFASSDCIE